MRNFPDFVSVEAVFFLFYWLLAPTFRVHNAYTSTKLAQGTEHLLRGGVPHVPSPPLAGYVSEDRECDLAYLVDEGRI